jgi:hypothetical protein
MSPPHLELQGAANLPSYQAIMSEESQQIVELFDKLIVAPIRALESRDVPNLHGVYVLYARPTERCCMPGRQETARAACGSGSETIGTARLHSCASS